MIVLVVDIGVVVIDVVLNPRKSEHDTEKKEEKGDTEHNL